MNNEDFKKLKSMYTQLIELVCYAKETALEEERKLNMEKIVEIIKEIEQANVLVLFPCK